MSADWIYLDTPEHGVARTLGVAAAGEVDGEHLGLPVVVVAGLLLGRDDHGVQVLGRERCTAGGRGRAGEV